MSGNICKFVPPEKYYDNINTVNFVYETIVPHRNSIIMSSYYVAYLTVKGSASFTVEDREYSVKEGDVFFTFPSTPFSLKPCDNNLEYIYISFLGIRAGKILEQLKINPMNCVFSDYYDLIPFWFSSISIATQNNLVMVSESVLLYTFSLISNRTEILRELPKESDVFLKIKKYIDDNYTSIDMSLQTLSRVFGYSEKYLSNCLKNFLGVGFSQYLKTLRIKHACSLMNDGYSNIKYIAYMSGYGDPLYFSKVFKKSLSKLPREYIADCRMGKNSDKK